MLHKMHSMKRIFEDGEKKRMYRSKLQTQKKDCVALINNFNQLIEVVYLVSIRMILSGEHSCQVCYEKYVLIGIDFSRRA